MTSYKDDMTSNKTCYLPNLKFMKNAYIYIQLKTY